MFDGWSDEDNTLVVDEPNYQEDDTDMFTDDTYDENASSSADATEAEIRKAEKQRKAKELEAKKRDRELLKIRINNVIGNMPNTNLELVHRPDGRKRFVENGTTKYKGLTATIKDLFFGEHTNCPVFVNGKKQEMFPRRETPPEIAHTRNAMPVSTGQNYHADCYGRGRDHGRRVANDLERIICHKAVVGSFARSMQTLEDLDNCAKEIILYLIRNNVIPVASEWKNSCAPIGCATAVDIVAIKDFRFLVHIEVKTSITPILVPITPGVMMKPPFSRIADTPLIRAEVQTLIASRIMVAMNPKIPVTLRKRFVPDNAYILFINPITVEIDFRESKFFSLSGECCSRVYDILARHAEARGFIATPHTDFFDKLNVAEAKCSGKKRPLGGKRGGGRKRR